MKTWLRGSTIYRRVLRRILKMMRMIEFRVNTLVDEDDGEEGNQDGAGD